MNSTESLKKHQCDKCSFTSSRKFNLQRHYKRKHDFDTVTSLDQLKAQNQQQYHHDQDQGDREWFCRLCKHPPRTISLETDGENNLPPPPVLHTANNSVLEAASYRPGIDVSDSTNEEPALAPLTELEEQVELEEWAELEETVGRFLRESRREGGGDEQQHPASHPHRPGAAQPHHHDPAGMQGGATI